MRGGDKHRRVHTSAHQKEILTSDYIEKRRCHAVFSGAAIEKEDHPLHLLFLFYSSLLNGYKLSKVTHSRLNVEVAVSYGKYHVSGGVDVQRKPSRLLC